MSIYSIYPIQVLASHTRTRTRGSSKRGVSIMHDRSLRLPLWRGMVSKCGVSDIVAVGEVAVLPHVVKVGPAVPLRAGALVDVESNV